MGHILSIRPSVDGRLGSWPFLPIVHRAAVHIYVQVKRCYFAASVETCFGFLGRNWRRLVFGQGAHMTPRACMNPSHITPRLTCSLAEPSNLFGRLLAAGESDRFQPSSLTASFCPGLWASCLLIWGWAKTFFTHLVIMVCLLVFDGLNLYNFLNLYVPFVLCWGPKLYMYILHLMFILWIFFFLVRNNWVGRTYSRFV